jgi:pimeloyl-ACP methyl ester carboxylesterase
VSELSVLASPTKESGRAWVLLHGTPLTPAVWTSTAQHLSDQPILVPDCTSVPATDSQQELARQVAEVIGDRAVDVVGHSFGGQTALELALLRPSQVRTLIILCSRDSPFPAFADLALTVRGGSPPATGDSLARWFTAAELDDNGAAVQQARIELDNASLPDWAAALEAIATFDRTTAVAELTMPVTLIAAGGDGVSTPQTMAAMANRIPHAVLTPKPGWKHMSAFVDPAALARLLRASRDRS